MSEATSPTEVVMAFLEAENARDWKTYRRFLSPSIEWTLLGREPRVVRGVNEYLRVMQDAYTGREARFTIEHVGLEEETGVVFAELDLEGRPSVDVFEVENGQIVREREYFGY